MIEAFLAAAVATAPVAVTDPWIREGPPTVSVLAGYLVVKNQAKKPITLRGATSPRFRLVELHKTIKDGDMMRMEPIKALKLAPGEAVTFVPGGNHLMLIDPKAPVKAGETVPLVLDFGPDGKAQAKLVVRGRIR